MGKVWVRRNVSHTNLIRIVVMIRVKGLGDYLPQYAGNLDIINCAAIAMAEEYAKEFV